MRQEVRPWNLYNLTPTFLGRLPCGDLYVQQSYAYRQGNQQLVPQRIMVKERRLIDEDGPLVQRLIEGVFRL